MLKIKNMSSQSQLAKRRCTKALPRSENPDEAPDAPLLDVFAGNPQSVILDDVSILKGQVTGILQGQIVPPKFTDTNWNLKNMAVFTFENDTSNTNGLIISDTANVDKVAKPWGTGIIQRGPITYNNGEFYLSTAGWWEIEFCLGIWLGGNSTNFVLGGYYQPGVPFTYSLLINELGSNVALRETVNGDGREGNGHKNSHVYLKRIRYLGGPGFSIQVIGNCNSTANKISSNGWIKFTLLSSV